MTVGNQYISDMEPTEPIMKDTIDGGGKNMFVDYHNSIVNLACSILKYFGAESEHSTFIHVIYKASRLNCLI